MKIKAEVKIEENGQIVYLNGERVNYLFKTVVIQDERHHMSKECFVNAQVWVNMSSGLPTMTFDEVNQMVSTPNGVKLPAVIVEKDDDFPEYIVEFGIDAVLA